MTPVVPARPLLVAIVLAALAGGVMAIALPLVSDHEDAQVVWATFGPAVTWSFVATGLYAWRRRPDSRIGMLMILLGFAWLLSTLQAANAPLPYTVALVAGGLWGSVFLHIGVSFPTGRLSDPSARTLAIAGYLVFPLAGVPALLFAGPHDLGCDDCPTSLLLVTATPMRRRWRRPSAHCSTWCCSASCWRGRCGAGGARRRWRACSSRRSTSSRRSRSCS